MRAGKTPDAPRGRARVLLLIKGLGVGGAERLLLDVVAARDEARFDYEVAHVLGAQDALAPALRAQGVAVHNLGATSSADLRWTLALRRVLVKGRFAVLHSHLPYSAAFGRLVALSVSKRRRPVLVYTEHSLWDRAAVLTKALNRATVGADQALLVVSEAARRALPPTLQERARVVTHGVHRDRFAPLAARRAEVRAEVRAELGLAEHEVLALTVANLRSEKGYDVLVEAARRTAAAGASVRFVSVGGGALEPAVARAAGAPELAHTLVFLGPRDDTARLMVGSDLFVLPSHQEGLPVALMEAMSAGLPVVATTVGGVPGVVRDGEDGILVPPGDAGALAAAVSTMAGDAALRARMAAASLTRSELFDVRRAARTIESVYDELLGRAPVSGGPVSGGPGAEPRAPLVLHVIPTAVARGAQREARALATVLDVPGTRHHRLLSLLAGPSGVPVDFDLAHPPRHQAGVGFDPGLARRLRAELARLDPAVVVAHGGDPFKYLVAATVGARRPLAYYATGTFEHAARPARVRAWRALMRRADVVACEGSEVLDEVRTLLRVPPARSLLAPNGRDPAEFHPPDGPPRTGPPTVAFVGAFTTGKRPDRFVALIEALRRRDLDVGAVACGDGPLMASLAAGAGAAGVQLLGSRSDVAEVLRGADVFVFPSRPTGEGMPGVLIEAGMTGLAVVATAVPGVRSVVEDGVTGFVVDPDDEDAMVDAAAALVADPALRRRMGEAARRRCTAQFSIDAVAACWTAFLTPLVTRALSRRAGRSGPGTRPGPGA